MGSKLGCFPFLAASISKPVNKVQCSHEGGTGVDEAFGFLPGELEDKTRPLLGCFYSNLEDLLRKGNHEEDAQIQMQIDDMMETGLLRGFPLAYISGMSIKNSFIICDEAQNIGRTLIKDIVYPRG